MTARNMDGPLPPGTARYGGVAIVLHWTIALAIIVQLILATRMGDRTPEAFAVIQLHKSIGITILLLSLVRLGWRLTHRPPPGPPLAGWERALSSVVHVGFYLIMIAMPLTGWLMVSASKLGLPTLLYGVVPWPHIPGVAELAAPQKKLAHEIGEGGHYYLAWTAIGLLALHVAGALKHQLFSPAEPVLGRMAPGAKAGRWLEPRLLVIAAAVGAAVLFAWTVSPPAARSPEPAPSAASAPVAVAEAAATASAPVASPPSPAASAKTAPSTPGPAAVATWTPSSGSTLDFETAWSGASVKGRFAKWTAQIVFAPAALDRSSVVVRVDLGSAETGDAQRDGMLVGPDWLDAGGHGLAVFTARRFSTAPGGGFVAHGTLALRGVKKPLDVPFKVTFSGNSAEAVGTAEIDRGAFGVGPGADEGGDQVPAKVKVAFSVKAKKGG